MEITYRKSGPQRQKCSYVSQKPHVPGGGGSSSADAALDASLELVREGAQKSEGFTHLLPRFPHVWSGDVENLRPFELVALTKKSVKSLRWSKQHTHEECMEMHYGKSAQTLKSADMRARARVSPEFRARAPVRTHTHGDNSYCTLYTITT